MIILNKEPSNNFYAIQEDIIILPNYFIEEVNGFKTNIDNLK